MLLLCLFLQCVFGFCFGYVGLFVGDGLYQFVVILGMFGFGRFFYFYQVYVMYYVVVWVYYVIVGEEIFNVVFVQVVYDLVGIGIVYGFDCFEVLVYG